MAKIPLHFTWISLILIWEHVHFIDISGIYAICLDLNGKSTYGSYVHVGFKMQGKCVFVMEYIGYFTFGMHSKTTIE